jgi:hypothetical protein
MASENFEKISVHNEHMDPDMFYDLLETEIGDKVTLDFPNFKGVIFISNIPPEEVERVVTAVKNAAGEILGKK